MKFKVSLAALAVAAVLAACGGGDDTTTSTPPPPPTSQVPPSASASVGGFIAYLQALIATPVATADTLEPVDTSMVTPPTDDIIEPRPVD